MEEIDIWRSANLLIEQHGDKAAEVAAGKIVEMQRAEDGDGMSTWACILMAIRALEKDKPSASEPRN